jgi:hypothetical protein
MSAQLEAHGLTAVGRASAAFAEESFALREHPASKSMPNTNRVASYPFIGAPPSKLRLD